MNKLFLLFTRFFIVILLVTLAACQTPIDKSTGWTSESGEVRPGPKTAKAVLSLLKKARQASKKGAFSTAESYLERALRIEPHNPTLWLYMAKLRLFAEKPKEAIHLAKKVLALSSRKRKLSQSEQHIIQSESWRILAHAYQKLGNSKRAKIAQNKAKALSD